MMMMMVNNAAKGAAQTQTRNRLMFLALTLGIGGVALLPYGIRKLRDGRSLYASDKPLTGSQVMRGAYMNTSSKDVGPDPDFEFATGEWRGRRNDPHKKQ